MEVAITIAVTAKKFFNDLPCLLKTGEFE